MHHKSWRPGFFAIIADTYVFFLITTPLQFPLHSRCRVRLIRVCESSVGRRRQKSYVARLALARLALALARLALAHLDLALARLDLALARLDLARLALALARSRSRSS